MFTMYVRCLTCQVSVKHNMCRFNVQFNALFLNRLTGSSTWRHWLSFSLANFSGHTGTATVVALHYSYEECVLYPHTHKNWPVYPYTCYALRNISPCPFYQIDEISGITSNVPSKLLQGGHARTHTHTHTKPCRTRNFRMTRKKATT